MRGPAVVDDDAWREGPTSSSAEMAFHWPVDAYLFHDKSMRLSSGQPCRLGGFLQAGHWRGAPPQQSLPGFFARVLTYRFRRWPSPAAAPPAGWPHARRCSSVPIGLLARCPRASSIVDAAPLVDIVGERAARRFRRRWSMLPPVDGARQPPQVFPAIVARARRPRLPARWCRARGRRPYKGHRLLLF